MDDNSTENRLVSTRCPSPVRSRWASATQDPAQRVQAGEHVDQCHADLGGITRFGAGDAHQPADGLHQQVVAGQGGAAVPCRIR